MRLGEILEIMSFEEECEIINDQGFEVFALVSSEIEKKSCVFLDNLRFLNDIKENVSMICTTAEVKKELERAGWKKGMCVTSHPRVLFFAAHNFLSLNENFQYRRKRFKSVIGEGCDIHKLAVISPENVVIGNNVKIEEFVCIRDNTTIGDNTIIRAGAKIGGEGFECKRAGGEIFSVIHAGGVHIGSNVEIQYNTCVDKAVYPWDNTEIGDYSKVDNLVHIGHAVKIKDKVMLVAQSGIGGRTVIDSDSWIGFAATVSNGLEMGKSARANIGAVVTKNVDTFESVTGNFAINHEKFIANLKKSI